MTASSCHLTQIKHDVFISFRGADVRHGLLSHLIKELRRGQIDAYVDCRLERGDEISSSLVRAIEESQILLVIFSKDYASSKWCLEELTKMIECMERNKQNVVPVFYNVDPSYVRNQKGDYGTALVEHEKKENMVKVQNWRSALEKAAQISGFHYPLNFENESDLVDEIVKDISNKLSKLCSSGSDDPSESNGLIGIDQNIAWIKSLLTIESTEVIKLGIWGMGGIGKTTIARVVFDTFSPQYQGCCFLENVGNEMKNHPLSYLQNKLVSILLEEASPHLNGRGKANFIKRRLSRIKVLVVLDDVDSPNLLKDFLEPICFGPGSIVIVTSRDKQVFTAGGFHEMHKVKELNFEESLKLFCINAFNESQPKIGYEELSKKAVAIAKGNPLALKVFGSHFHFESKDIWESAIEKLKKYPDRNIQRVLQLSYDGLDYIEKKVFLDIAFFFKEEDKGYVIRLLDAWGFHGACGIKALQDKALITISNDNRIQMHDLIQKMGWEIVRQESTDLGRRSRLRDVKEVYDVLKNNKKINLVEGMLIDVSQIREVALYFDSLKRMPNLRLLKCYSSLRTEIPKETRVPRVLDCMQISDSIIMSRRLIELNVENLMLSLRIEQDSGNVKGSVRDTPKQFMKLQKFSKLPNNNECDEVVMANNVSLTPLLNLDIRSALKELMDLGAEVHIKSLHYLFMEGRLKIRPMNSIDTGIFNSNLQRSDSDTEGLQHQNVVLKESSILPKQMRQLNLTDTRMELLNSSTGYVSSLECSETDGQQLETLPNEVTVLRSTYYHRLFNCREQDATRKPNLQVLFDGFQCSEQKMDPLFSLLGPLLAPLIRRVVREEVLRALEQPHQKFKNKRRRDVFDLETTATGNGIGSCGDQESLPPKKMKGSIG